MLFTNEQIEGIRSGKITLTFRKWKRPQARAGRFQRTAAGMVKIDSVDVVQPADIPDGDALKAGFARRGDLISWTGAEPVYRVAFHLEGSDSRVALRESVPAPSELETIERRLSRMDAKSPRGPWVAETLKLIEAMPARRAGDLAAAAGVERDEFKKDVRRLKELGLTISLEIGYRLSPRGQAVLDHLRSRSRANAQQPAPE